MDGITNIPANGQLYYRNTTPDVIRQTQATPEVATPIVPTEASLQSLKKELAALAPELNQRMEFSFRKDLGQVVVKIIDTQTDTIIKELPPTEFQRVHLAIREAIGLLFDKKA